MNLQNLYEELLAGKRITITIPDTITIYQIYAALRLIKHRYDKKYLALTGEKLSENKVIRYVENNTKTPPEITIFLGEKLKKSSIDFKIIECQEDIPTSGTS